MKKLFILLISITFIGSINAQRWKQYRYDAFFGVGTTNFLGDLGGGAKEASNFLSFRDIDAASTRPAFHIGGRYKLYEMITIKSTFLYGFIDSRDEKSGEIGRQRRNLSFRSPLFEASAQMEYFFIKEKVSSRYQISKGLRNLVSAYVFVGLGGFYFNPQALGADGNWYALQPLGTEGQGHVNHYYDQDGIKVLVPEKYKRFQLSIPLGIGLKYTLNRYWSLGVEVTARYTSTDYIDDASNRYFNFYQAIDKGWIEGDYTDYALNAYFADRHIEITNWDSMDEVHKEVDETNWLEYNKDGWEEHRYPSGKKYRGNPDYNDTYMFINISMYYKLSTTRSGRPKFK